MSIKSQGAQWTQSFRFLSHSLSNLHPRLGLATMLMAPLPPFVGARLRVYILRAAGFRIGNGTLMWGKPTIIGSGDICSHLTIGAQSGFNVGLFLDIEAPITIGDQVSVGHHVMILTKSYQVGSAERRAGEPICAPVTIGDGAWVGACSLILPGVTIGAGAVISAGSVVKQDVLPNMLISGKQKIPLDRWRVSTS